MSCQMEDFKITVRDGVVYTYKDDYLIHSFNGNPAIISPNGYEAYFREGFFLRDNNPTADWSDNNNEYWIRGKPYSKSEYYKYYQEEALCEKLKKVASDRNLDTKTQIVAKLNELIDLVKQL